MIQGKTFTSNRWYAKILQIQHKIYQTTTKTAKVKVEFAYERKFLDFAKINGRKRKTLSHTFSKFSPYTSNEQVAGLDPPDLVPTFCLGSFNLVLSAGLDPPMLAAQAPALTV